MGFWELPGLYLGCCTALGGSHAPSHAQQWATGHNLNLPAQGSSGSCRASPVVLPATRMSREAAKPSHRGGAASGFQAFKNDPVPGFDVSK